MGWFSGPTTLSAADYGVAAAALLLLFLVGFLGGRGEATTADFFLGRRRIPWWAAALSFVATEISAMTLIGVPATAYRENWQYAQFYIGSAGARIVIAFLFIPAFYRYDCTTIYEFLRHRFGRRTQVTATVFFFVTRLLASGVRLMAASVAVSILLGWNLIPVIALFTAVSVLYIGFGGIKAVIWTNVLQAATFVAAGVATLFFLGDSIQGGLEGALGIAGQAGRLSLWNLGPPLGEPGWLKRFLADPNILWVAVLNGFFGSMAAFGTDHELMQRLLTVETRRASQRTMLHTILGSLAVLVIYLAVGTGLFAFYAQHPELALPEQLDKVYPHFVVQAMPELLRGLVLAAIVMASIDSPLASLSASFVTDIYRPLRPQAGERHYLAVSRACVLAFGLALGALAYGFSFFDKMLWLAFKIGGVTFGSLLGVFLLGLLTERKGGDSANVFAMIAMAAINLALLVLSEMKVIQLGWSWLVILGTFGTMALATAVPVFLGPLTSGRRL